MFFKSLYIPIRRSVCVCLCLVFIFILSTGALSYKILFFQISTNALATHVYTEESVPTFSMATHARVTVHGRATSVISVRVSMEGNLQIHIVTSSNGTFPRYWPFVRGIHRSLVNSPHEGQWRGTLKFSLICAWTNGWATPRDAGELRRHCAHYDVTIMLHK